MSERWRVMIVVLPRPERRPDVAPSRWSGLPPRDTALIGSELLAAGAEVRVVDQAGEELGFRVARREVRLWRADLVLAYGGGPMSEMDPVPDASSLAGLAAGWRSRAPLIAIGPLATLYGPQLLEAVPRLAGVLAGGVGPELARRSDLADVPGLTLRGAPARPPAPARERPGPLPAWQLLAMAAYERGGRLAVPVACDGGGADRGLAEVRHAVRRAGAATLVFVDPDLLADAEEARDLARGMLAAGPGRPWIARVRADHVEPTLALALSQGGCQELLVTWPEGPDAPGLPPMDDPHRPLIENAVDVVRVTGTSFAVEFVVGRPGHHPDVLRAWQRWFRDRRIAVKPRVRLAHPAPGATDALPMAEVRARAGCQDNALRPKDVARAMKWFSESPREALAP